MTNSDPVAAELDAEERRLLAELTKVREFKAWWLGRHQPDMVVPDEGGGAAVVEVKTFSGGGTTKDWIRRVLSGGGKYRPSEIAKEAQTLGWATTSGSPNIIIRNSLRTMDDVGRDDDNRYFLKRHLASVATDEKEVVTN